MKISKPCLMVVDMQEGFRAAIDNGVITKVNSLRC